jgi:hypothetical protein
VNEKKSATSTDVGHLVWSMGLANSMANVYSAPNSFQNGVDPNFSQYSSTWIQKVTTVDRLNVQYVDTAGTMTLDTLTPAGYSIVLIDHGLAA